MSVKNIFNTSTSSSKDLCIRLILALSTTLSTMALVGCGSSYSNGVATPDPVNTLSPGEITKARCSHDIDNQADFAVKAMTSETNGIVDSGKVRLKFEKFPAANFSTSGSALMAVFAKQVDAAGTVGTWQQVNFGFAKGATGSFTDASPYQYGSMTWDQLKQLGSYNGITATTPDDIFSQLSLIVDISANASTIKALAVKLYNGSYSPEILVLIPAFEADPKQYNITHPSTYLQNLHPLKQYASSNWTQAQYLQQSQNFCF